MSLYTEQAFVCSNEIWLPHKHRTHSQIKLSWTFPIPTQAIVQFPVSINVVLVIHNARLVCVCCSVCLTWIKTFNLWDYFRINMCDLIKTDKQTTNLAALAYLVIKLWSSSSSSSRPPSSCWSSMDGGTSAGGGSWVRDAILTRRHLSQHLPCWVAWLCHLWRYLLGHIDRPTEKREGTESSVTWLLSTGIQ